MPQYITRPGGHDTTYAAPYNATGVKMMMYFLNADYANLSATIDRYLNAGAPADEHFIPFGDRIVACFTAMAQVVGVDAGLGFMREIDVAFIIPAIRFKGGLPKEIVAFAPYLFVDIPQAAASGREVHGYRKDLGTSFSATDTFADAWVANATDLTHVEGWAVPNSGDRLQRKRLVDITLPTVSAAPVAWPDSAAVLQDMLDNLIGSPAAVSNALALFLGSNRAVITALIKPVLSTLLGALLKGPDLVLPVVFLRQFRNPFDSTQADVQAVLRANLRLPLAQLSGQKQSSGYHVTFHDMASHPFSTELGIPSGTAQASNMTVEASCAFTLEEAS